jgi:hypothetical protein
MSDKTSNKLWYGRSTTRMQEVLDSVVTEFGGPVALAKAIFASWQQAKPGSLTQIRVMDTVMKMLISYDSRQKGIEDQLDEATELQLAAIVRDLSREVDVRATIDPNGAPGGAEQASRVRPKGGGRRPSKAHARTDIQGGGKPASETAT